MSFGSSTCYSGIFGGSGEGEEWGGGGGGGGELTPRASNYVLREVYNNISTDVWS